MLSTEVRSKFLKFFESKGHKIMPSSSLVPENDSSVLFTTAGMQQFKPYYIAPENAIKDFGIKNVVTVQKCIRTGDIDEVGDSTHLTFFEMLGNFSFGGYGRKEAIEYAHEFITKELGLEISYVTFYKGEGVVPRDEESKDIWASLGVRDIRADGADVFWGPTGDSGPCGPTTEIYCKNGYGEDVEIWNIVFNEYFCDGSREKLDKGEAKLKKLESLGIDTGMGFERLLSVVQQTKSVFHTDLLVSEINYIKTFCTKYERRSARIVADHFRSAVFIILDGATPSNTGRGYILRRLLRRVFTKAAIIGLPKNFYEELAKLICEKYINYPELQTEFARITGVVSEERKVFEKPLNDAEIYRADLEAARLGVIKKMGGVPILKDSNTASGEYIYKVFETFGYPIELSVSIAEELGFIVDQKAITEAIEAHQNKSRTASAGMFKGGLADQKEKTINHHTAHHLLLAALQAVVNPDIKQRGSNITEERLRIDFSLDRKLTEEEKKKVEDWVNDKINRDLKVVRREMPKDEAENIGAQMEFGAKYPEVVSVYFIEDKDGQAVSKEFCGGPHVSRTGELGTFKILKEEASSQGVRRIKAVLL